MAVVGENKETFRVIRLSDFTTVHELVGHGYSGLQSAAFSADNRNLYTIVWDGSLARTRQASRESEQGLLDLENRFAPNPNQAKVPQSVQFDRRKQRITSQLHRWDLSTGELIDQIGDDERAIIAVVGAPDGGRVGIVSVRHESLDVVKRRFQKLDSRIGEFMDQSPWLLRLTGRFDDPILGSLGLRYTPSGNSVLLASEGTLFLIDRKQESIRWQQSIESQVNSASLYGNEVWWLSDKTYKGKTMLRFEGQDVLSGRPLTPMEFVFQQPSGPKGASNWLRPINFIIDAHIFSVSLTGTAPGEVTDYGKNISYLLTIDRASGSLRDAMPDSRADLLWDEDHFLAGAAKVNRTGEVLDTLRKDSNKDQRSVVSTSEESIAFGRPIYITDDDQFAVYENRKSFVVWNLAEGRQELIADRPSKAIPYSTIADRWLTTESQVGYAPDDKTFLVAVPMMTQRSAKELLKCLGRNKTYQTPQGPLYVPYSQLLSSSSVSDSLLTLGHEFFCGYQWQFFTWSMEHRELSEFSKPINAATLDVVRNRGDWVVASIASDHGRLQIDRLTQGGREVIGDFETTSSKAFESKSTFISLLSTGDSSRLGVMKESKLIAVNDGQECLVVLHVDPFIDDAETVFRRNTPTEEFVSQRFEHPFPMQGQPSHRQVSTAALDPSSRLLATLSADLHRGRYKTSPGSHRRSTTFRCSVNLFDTQSGRAYGRIMVPETFIDFKVKEIIVRLPNGKQATEAGMASWPIGFQLSPPSTHCSIRIGGEKLKQGILDIESKELVREFQTDHVLRFLNDGRHALLGDQVIELKAGGDTIAIADFRTHEENDQ